MRKVERLIKITVVLIFVAFMFRLVYVKIIIPSPFRNELETCIENSKKLDDPLEIEIAEELCSSVYSGFN
jgi:hypothetical protein